MKLITVLFLLALVSTQYQLWINDNGYTKTLHMQTYITNIKNEINSLEERNEILEAEVLDLKHGHNAIEELARIDMGMVAEDETFYQVVIIDDHTLPLVADPTKQSDVKSNHSISVDNAKQQ